MIKVTKKRKIKATKKTRKPPHLPLRCEPAKAQISWDKDGRYWWFVLEGCGAVPFRGMQLSVTGKKLTDTELQRAAIDDAREIFDVDLAGSKIEVTR